MTSRVVIPEDRDVGDERQEEVNRARREVHADGGDVPEERRPEVRMLENVERPIRPPQVEKDAADAEEQHEHGDDLGGPGDGPSPLGVREPEELVDDLAVWAFRLMEELGTEPKVIYLSKGEWGGEV